MIWTNDMCLSVDSTVFALTLHFLSRQLQQRGESEPNSTARVCTCGEVKRGHTLVVVKSHTHQYTATQTKPNCCSKNCGGEMTCATLSALTSRHAFNREHVDYCYLLVCFLSHGDLMWHSLSEKWQEEWQRKMAGCRTYCIYVRSVAYMWVPALSPLLISHMWLLSMENILAFVYFLAGNQIPRVSPMRKIYYTLDPKIGMKLKTLCILNPFQSQVASGASLFLLLSLASYLCIRHVPVQSP